MNFQHKDAASGRWFEFSLVEQMANIGSEVIRAINWRKKGNEEYAMAAFYRALELFDLTKTDPKNKGHLGEVCRARELFAEYFYGNNPYHDTAQSWEKYFLQFNYAARLDV